MKKLLKRLCLMCVMVLFVLAMMGCQKQQEVSEEQQDKIEGDVTEHTLLIAAAASLEYAFTEKLIPMFEQNNPNVKIEGTYDSSGKLQTQIEEGMEADLFFSAATKQMDALVESGYIDQQTVASVLENELVLIVPADSKFDGTDFKSIAKGITIALGDPESVPVGQYAKEALTNLGIWDNIQSKVSFGTNVTEVLKWVEEGSADVGVVYATDAATTDKVRVVAKAPQGSLATPVIYPIGVLKNSKNYDIAMKFSEFLQSKEAKDIFAQYGFTPQN